MDKNDICQWLNVTLSDGSFWMNHVIHKSPADGHCLIYSLVTGIESMHPSWRISSQRILDALKQETLSNMEMYIPFVDGASQESLINAMNAYVLHKIYNTLFGDNVPQIVANALGINIIIINKTEHLHNVSMVCPYGNGSFETSKYVFVYKHGLHYDGLCRTQCDRPSQLWGQTPVDLMHVSSHAGSVCGNDQKLPRPCYDTIVNDVRYEPIINDKSYCLTDSSNLSPVQTMPTHECVTDHDGSDFSGFDEYQVHARHRPVNIISWNINGLSQDKLNDALLGSFLKQFDIILLSETWASTHDAFSLDGYVYHNYPRKSKHLKSKRESGGLGIFIHHGIQEGILKWSHTDDIIAWIILKKSFFGLENDIYLANIYIVPEGSTYLKHDEFNLLYQQILKVPDESEIALCGDYNARTGILPDIDFHADGSNAGLNELLPHDDLGIYDLINEMRHRDVLTRSSRDKSAVNKHGIQLLELCKSAGILTLNGRIGHDNGIGEFTRDVTTGKSVVDYAIGTPKLFNLVRDLRVHRKFPESDHRPISLSIMATCIVSNSRNRPPVEWEPHAKYIWSHEGLNNLVAVMNDRTSESFRLSFTDSVAELCDVDTVARKFDQYISQACERTFKQVKRQHRVNKKGPAWYDAECRRKRALAVHAGERVMNENDRELQTLACREYGACKQRKQRNYNKKCIEDIKSAYFSNRGNMWGVLEKISNRSTSQITLKIIITLAAWALHRKTIILTGHMKPMPLSSWGSTIAPVVRPVPTTEIRL